MAYTHKPTTKRARNKITEHTPFAKYKRRLLDKLSSLRFLKMIELVYKSTLYRNNNTPLKINFDNRFIFSKIRLSTTC